MIGSTQRSSSVRRLRAGSYMGRDMVRVSTVKVGGGEDNMGRWDMVRVRVRVVDNK